MKCLFCGEKAVFEVTEIWPKTREFDVWACCGGNYEAWIAEMQDWSREEWKEFIDYHTGLSVRGVPQEPGVGYAIDWGIRLGPVSLKTAKEFVRCHHRHNPPPAGWRWGLGAYNGSELIGVAMVGRPVARMLDPGQYVEVNRLCVKDMRPRELVWNAASMLYGAAAREAKKRGYETILTYTLADEEEGTSLKAAGWTPVKRTRGGSWNRPGRPREDRAPTVPKIRWERRLTRRPPAQCSLPFAAA